MKCANPDCKKPGQWLDHHEKHDICLWCLGQDHDPYECDLCSQMSSKSMKLRNEARLKAIEHSVWPLTHSAPRSKSKAGSVATDAKGKSKKGDSSKTKLTEVSLVDKSLSSETISKPFSLEEGQVLELEDVVTGSDTQKETALFESVSEGSRKVPSKSSSHQYSGKDWEDELGEDQEIVLEEGDLSDSNSKSSARHSDSVVSIKRKPSSSSESDEKSVIPSKRKKLFDPAAFKASLVDSVSKSVADAQDKFRSELLELCKGLSAGPGTATGISRKTGKAVPCTVVRDSVSVPTPVNPAPVTNPVLVPTNPPAPPGSQAGSVGLGSVFQSSSDSADSSQLSDFGEEIRTKNKKRRRKWTKAIFTELPGRLEKPKGVSAKDEADWQ